MQDSADTTLTITGGEAIARMIAAFHGGPMFGMGGFQLLPFYDAARRLGLDHHLINDERAGTFAADAYAKVTRRVGLVDATLGPGATNLVTGLIEALNAGTPMIAIIGDTHRDHSWKNMTQESRQIDILRPAVKELIEITTPKRIPELVRRAFTVATSGRPGPVVLNVPEDVSHMEWEYEASEFYGIERYESVPALRFSPEAGDLDAAAELIAEATRPVLLVGGGVHLSGAHEALVEFADALNVPVAHTMTGKGAIPCTHRLSMGVFGRYDRIANQLIEQSDLVIVVGCKLGEIATKRYTIPAAGSRIIHIESVPEEIDRTHEAYLPLCGDARETLAALSDRLASRSVDVHSRQQEYADGIAVAMTAWRSSVHERLTSDEVPVNMARLMDEINTVMPEDGILIADGGFAAHWSALLFDTKKSGRHFLPDRGFASIGYGLPGAIGAALAAPGRSVVALSGDGGLNMMLGEMETARRLGVTPTIVVVNNAASGYVKALQHLVYGAGNYQASDLVETDYAAIANAMGCRGVRVTDPDQLGKELAEAINSGVLTVLDVIVTRDPAKMLPGVDSRTVTVRKGDRVA